MLEIIKAEAVKAGLETIVPAADKNKADALVDMMREQAAVMGREEQREMLAFMRGVTFGRTFGGSL